MSERKRPAGRTSVATGPARGNRSAVAGRTKPGKSIVNQKQTPWGLIATVAVLVLFAAAVIVVVVQRSHKTSAAATGQIIPAAPTGAVTVEQRPKQVANVTGIPGVLAWDTTGWPGNGAAHPGAVEHEHVTGPVTYAVIPPIGGPHNAIWMNAGVYTAPIPSERAVHNLEHGAIWITYDPNLKPSEVAALVAFVGKQTMIPESQQAAGVANQANRYLDLSPWAANTLPSPIVLSSWGYQLRVSSPTDPRMQQFVNMFRNSPKYSPEYGSAVDGVPVQTGGRPAEYGSRQPNPPGA